MLQEIMNLFQSPDCHNLMEQFIQTCEIKKITPTLPLFYQHFYEDKATLLLIKIYGCLQSRQIFKQIGEFAQLYQKELKHCLQNLTITLQYHLEDLKSKRQLTHLPSNIQYSWHSDSYFDARLEKEQVHYGLALGIFISPMPQQLFKLFALHPIVSLKQRAEQHQQKYQAIIAKIYASLKVDKKNINLLEAYKTPLELLKAEKLLLNHAAFTHYPFFHSWIEELLAWSEATGQRQRLCELLKYFKLSCLIVPAVQQIFSNRNVLLNSPKDKGIVVGGLLQHLYHRESSKQIHSPEKKTPFITEKEKTFQFDDSFQHYLIKKMIDQLILSYCPLQPHLQRKVAEIFEQDESQRLDFIFLIHLLNSLFRPSNLEQQPTLREMVDLAFPSSSPLKQIDKICRVLDCLFPHHNELSRLARAYSYLFFLDYSNQFQISLTHKSLLLHWMYEENDSSTALAGLYENSFSFTQLPRFPSRVLTGLPDHFVIKYPDQLILISIWEILLTPRLPPTCLNRLLEESLKLSVKTYDPLFGLLCGWFRLYPSGSSLPDLMPWVGSLCSTETAEKYQKILEESAPPSTESIFHSLEILRTHESLFDRSFYDLLHATLHLIHYCSYMDLNVGAQEFLFQHILVTSQQDREACAQELLKFASTLPQTPGSLPQKRLEKLHQAYKDNLQIYPNPLLEELLKDWPAHDQWLHFQILLIRKLEDFSHTQISLATILFLLLYCPYPPFMRKEGEEIQDSQPFILDELETLSQLRTTLDLQHQHSLFIPPTIISQINQHNSFLMNTDLYISSRFYASGNATDLEVHIGAVIFMVRNAILPPLSFGMNIFRQIQELFEEKKNKEINRNHQNILCFAIDYSQEKMVYRGEWQGLLYMAEWSLKGTTQAYPHLNVVLWRSFNELESRHFNILLKIPVDKLNPTLWKLLEKILTSLEQEIEQEDQQVVLEKLSSSEEEFQFCLSIDAELNEAYESFLSKAPSNEMKEDVLCLFEFVKILKLEIRMAHAALFLPSEKKEKRYVPSQAGIIYDSSKFQFLSTHEQENFSYQLKHEELQSEFQALCHLLRNCQNSQTIDHFCEIKTPQGTWKISLSFDSLKMENEANSNQLTMIAHSPQPHTYSVKLKHLIDHPNLEAFLRWQFLMLKSHY